MPKKRFERHETSFSTNRVGTDALNAMIAIQGVSDPVIFEESDHHAVISYSWDELCVPPENPSTYFMAFGLKATESVNA